jgi:hypothetical protein
VRTRLAPGIPADGGSEHFVNRNTGLTAGIVALLALMARVAVPAGHGQSTAGQAERGGQAKKAQAPEAAAAPQQPYEGPWIATRHFFAPDQPPPDVTDASSQALDFKNPEAILSCSADTKCVSELRQFFGLRDTEGVDCLLATVPDPYHTRLALFTDHSIEAIRKGAGAEEWEFATQWLPWNDTVDSTESDPQKRAQARSDIRAQEKQPGVLVFRRGTPGALLIFLAGETPTAGVNPDQFQIARAYMQALGDPRKKAEPVRIDGPTFSGSFHSLASLILQDRARPPWKTYQVRSGTAQSQDAVRVFRERTQPGVEFHAAIESLGDQDRHFHDVLKELRIPPERAAVLAEGDSTFGRAASHQDAAGPVRVFRFPRDISHLRDAYRQSLQAATPDKAPAPSLEFSLKDPNVGEDSVPTYSSTQTPLSQNGVINEITRTIQRDDIRIVEMSGSNVLDLLFLAGVLRRQCPDTRLLIQFADLLFIQGEQTQPLDGTLFLTSYPLFAESKLWEEAREGPKEITLFPDTLSEGVFNATVLLLAGEDKFKLTRELSGYTWQSVHYPPAWLLTLDRRGFTPVRVWPNDAAKGWFQSVWGVRRKLDMVKVASPRMLNVVSSLFALLGAAAGIWILRLLWNKHWVADARFELPESGDPWRGFYLFLFLLILIGIQVAIFLARPFAGDWPRLLLMLSGCGLPAWIVARYCRPGKTSRRAMWWAAAAVLAGAGLWSYCCLGGESQGQLFAFRAAGLRFGSSPLWPILAAAAALLLWCFVHVTRLYFVTCGQPDVLTSGVGALKGRLEASHRRFVDAASSALGLSTPHQRSGFQVAVAVVVGLCCLFRLDVDLSSIDGAPYDILCIALQILVAGLLLLTCFHIRILWRSLHDFTMNLGLLPLARAFIQVSPAGGNRPIWVRHFNLQSLDIHTNSVLVLHDMKLQKEQLTSHGLSVARVDRWQKIYHGRIKDLMTVDPPPARDKLTDAHQKLWRFSKQVAGHMWKLILKPEWESEPLVGKLAGGPSAKPEELAPDRQDGALTSEQPLNIPGDPKKVADLAETLVALHYSPFLMYAVRQIRNLLWFPCVGFVLLMLSMNSYNFQAPHLSRRLLMLLFAAMAWMLGTCMIEMERDPILSRIAGNQPGELNAKFYLKAARYGALPVLGLLATQFPSISNLLLSWLEPALEALQ